MANEEHNFLGITSPFCDLESAAVAVLPVPYEGGVSYGHGAAEAPDAIIHSSAYIEFYDEILKKEPYLMGIATVAPVSSQICPDEMAKAVASRVEDILSLGKFPVIIGGDHSITSPAFFAVHENLKEDIGVIQLDAHADLREIYEGTHLSHACVMARIRERNPNTLQIGIRSMSIEEAEYVKLNDAQLCTMHEFRKKAFDIDQAINSLPDRIYLTIDLDVFDGSVIMNTGTPEPGGFVWDEALSLIENIFYKKNVIGFDVVELSAAPWDRYSPFAAAKLIYKMIGFKLSSEVHQKGCVWPEKPNGSIFKK